MNLPVRVAATGNLGGTNGGTLCSAMLRATSDTASAVIREGGSGGTIIAELSAVANTTASHTFARGIVYQGQLHATMGGTAPSLTVELEF